MEWLQLNHPWIYLAGFILVWIGRSGIPAAWRLVKATMTLWKALEELAALPPLIRRLEKEVLPNGGNSLGDIVRRIDRETAIMRERQRLVMELTPLYGWFETDAHGRCVRASHTYCTWLQRSVDELQGSGWE